MDIRARKWIIENRYKPLAAVENGRVYISDWWVLKDSEIGERVLFNSELQREMKRMVKEKAFGEHYSSATINTNKVFDLLDRAYDKDGNRIRPWKN